jgi:2-oxoglutarate ferredoxin oxidoreductase subunit gamma
VPSPASGVPARRLEIRLSGSGGQGLVLASTVLAEAAVATGREVVQTQTYGPEARGGASCAEVILSDEEIDFPELVSPDITVCLSQEAFDTFAAVTRDGGLVLYDEQLVVARPMPGVHLVGVPLTSLAQQAAGTPLAANIVALGVLEKLAAPVPVEALIESLRRRLPERLLQADLAALQVGLETGRRPRPRRAANRRRSP